MSTQTDIAETTEVVIEGPESKSKENDETSTSKSEATSVAEDKSKDKQNLKKLRKRPRHRYQTHDLIREISPTLEEQIANNIDHDGKNRRGDSREVKDKVSVEQKATLQPKRTVQCNICKRRMTESKLANHIRLLHVEANQPKSGDENLVNGKRKDYRCEYCGKSYAIKYTFDQHVKTHTEGRPKCPECGATFASAFSLFRHRAKSHNLEHNYTTYNCDKCDKIFFSISELTLHQQRHSEKKDHQCPECKKAFSVKGNLRIHMRTHAKEKLYKCDICENSFSHPYSLVSHRRIHTNEYPFRCDVCCKCYRSKHQLTSHMNVHSDNRPFKCDDCSKTFRSRTAFKMHQDLHRGIKRFVCKFCDRKFQCHANKLKHERRHIGIKRHKCDQCDKAFIEKQELRNHLKVHKKQVSGEGAKSRAKVETVKKSPKPDTAPIEPVVETPVVNKKIILLPNPEKK